MTIEKNQLLLLMSVIATKVQQKVNTNKQTDSSQTDSQCALIRLFEGVHITEATSFRVDL